MLKSRHLGALALSSSEDAPAYSEASIDVAGRPVPVHLTVRDANGFDGGAVEALDAHLDALDAAHRTALEAIGAQLKDPSSTAFEFWTFYREEVEPLGDLSSAEFLARLRLARVGLYPDGAYGARGYVTLDYEIPEPRNDQLLVARFAENRSLLDLSWES